MKERIVEAFGQVEGCRGGNNWKAGGTRNVGERKRR